MTSRIFAEGMKELAEKVQTARLRALVRELIYEKSSSAPSS
jgi:hypothetical protein